MDKVDEEDIERVNTILAERMAHFYDLERDDGSGEYFLVKTPRTRMTGGFIGATPPGGEHHITGPK